MLSDRLRRSLETKGLSVQPITPPAEDNRSFTASGVAGCVVITHRSTAETEAVGTLTAEHSTRPARSGNTRSRSRPALVVVGTIDKAAARPRARSAPRGASTVGWLPV